MYRLYCLRGYSVKTPTVIIGILILYAISIILVKIQGVVQCLPFKYNTSTKYTSVVQEKNCHRHIQVVVPLYTTCCSKTCDT